MKKRIVILISLILFSISILNAQSPPNPPDNNDPFDPVGGGDDPVGVPIDGGALVLLIAGAAYGVKKLKKKSVKS
jgi:hypothetical protein